MCLRVVARLPQRLESTFCVFFFSLLCRFLQGSVNRRCHGYGQIYEVNKQLNLKVTCGVKNYLLKKRLNFGLWCNRATSNHSLTDSLTRTFYLLHYFSLFSLVCHPFLFTCCLFVPRGGVPKKLGKWKQLRLCFSTAPFYFPQKNIDFLVCFAFSSVFDSWWGNEEKNEFPRRGTRKIRGIPKTPI